MKKFYVGVKGIVKDPKQGIILLHRDYKSGDYWDTPGGRMDGEEDFVDTLKRELAEELPGIKVKEVGDLVAAFRLQKDIDGDTSLVLLYFLVTAELPSPVQLSDEHESHIWISNRAGIPEGVNPELRKVLDNLLRDKR